jgi:hypothetical protein
VVALTVLVILLVGAFPLLPLLVRPLTTHREAWVQFVGRLVAWLLLWAAFNLSLMAIWGAVRFVPEWWALLVGVPALQVPAAWFSYRVVFRDGNGRGR